jgi:hypothetical protein
MATELNELKATIKKIEKELSSVRAKVRAMESREKSGTPPFSKLEGAWQGAGFTEEDIEAAKIKIRDTD